MKESAYQAKLIKKIHELIPDCIILKNDPTHLQGIPDLTILHGPNWAALEVKVDESAPVQPNQPYYVDVLNGMSYAAFIHPGNEGEVLHDLQKAFGLERETCVP